MRNFFNRSKDSKEDIKLNFLQYIKEKNINTETYNNGYDFIDFFLDACKNKNVNNLLAMKELGFSLKNIDTSHIHESFVRSSKHSNFKDYFNSIFNMDAIKDKDMSRSKHYDMYGQFCLLSYLIKEKKEDRVEYLIENGYPDNLVSSRNIMTSFLSGGKFKETEEIFIKNKVKVNPENIENELNYIRFDTNSAKNDYLSFVNRLLKDNEMNNSYAIRIALWSGLLLNPLVSIKEIEKNVPKFELFKGTDLWSKFIESHLTTLSKINGYFNFNPAIEKDYPAKLNFFKENYNDDNYQFILSNFIRSILLKPKDKEMILLDLEKNHDIKKELLNIKDEIKKKSIYGHLDSYKIYNQYYNDEKFAEECLDGFVRNQIIDSYNNNTKGKMKHWIDQKMIESMIDTFANSHSINKTFDSDIELDEFTNYSYSIFGLVINSGNEKLVKKVMSIKNFDVSKNIEMYINNQMTCHLVGNLDVEESKKEIYDKLKIINNIKQYKDLKINFLFLENVNSPEILTESIKIMNSDFESVQIVKSLLKKPSKIDNRKKRL